jgi:penicillin-binding protein 1A
VVQRGTGTAALVLNRPVGGKTGTTNEYRSAWFVGFTPQIVAGVFVGYDDNRSLGFGETGTQAALPIFVDFMKVATKDLPKDEFKAPKNAKYAMVRGIREAFRPGTEPRAAAPSAAVSPTGPQPYNKVWPDGVVTGAPSSGQAVPAPKKADDMSGLY